MQSRHFVENKWGNNGYSDGLYLLGLQNHCRWWLQPWNEKTLAPWKESYDQPRQHIKKRDITLLTKVHLVKAVVFPVVMYGCETWTTKKAERKCKCQSLSHVWLCDHMDCSPPGSSVHRILQARILEWVAIPFSRRSSQPRDRTQVSCIVGKFFTIWATREVLMLLNCDVGEDPWESLGLQGVQTSQS